MVELKTEVFGARGVQLMFDVAPRAYTRGVKTWLAKEQSSFVGSKKRLGSWQKFLGKKKKTGGRDGTWSTRQTKVFKGYIKGADKIQGMQLVMGAGLRSESPYVQGIAKMQDGYTQTSENMMPMPHYEGLRNAGIGGNFSNVFKDMVAQKRLDIVKSNGRVYFFERGQVGRLLFTGVGKMHVPKQFDFYSTWSRRLPKVLDRGQRQIETVTKNIASGKTAVA